MLMKTLVHNTHSKTTEFNTKISVSSGVAMSSDVVDGGKDSGSRSNSSNGIAGFRGAFRFTKNAMISSFASGKSIRVSKSDDLDNGQREVAYVIQSQGVFES